MRHKLAVLALLTLAMSSMAKNFPFGSGVVPAVRAGDLKTEYWTDSNGVQHPIWQDPEIQFIVIRDTWALAEPSDGVYDWSYLDHGKNLAVQYAKNIVMSVNGAVYPQWLADEGVPVWQSHASGKTCLYPWNSTLQSKFAAFISAMGARYQPSRYVVGVTMYAGGTAIECFFAEDSVDTMKLDGIAGGGTGSGAVFWENAAKTLINDYIAAFPTTSVYLATGNCYAGDNHASMTDLANWFYAMPVPGSLQSNALSRTFPNGTFPHTTESSSSYLDVMYQYLQPIKTLQQSDPMATNTNVTQNAYNNSGVAVQAYPNDASNDSGAGEDYFNDLLGL